jgi:ClpP class serine protease
LLSSRKKIDESALTGLSYKPKDALALGLIDKIGTFDDALAKAKNYATSKPKYTSMFFPKISSLFVKETPKTDEEGLAKIEAALTEKENQLQQAQMKIESLTAELEAFKAQGNKLTDLEAKIEKLQKDNEALAKFPADEPTKVGSQNDVTNLINNEKKSWETAAHNQILNKRYQKFNKN